jgi:hypothetical protein
MIRAYSQRLLPPYSGVVQISESERARAQSFDGINWEIHYFSGNEQADGHKHRVQGYGLDRGYFNVASLKKGELKVFIIPACVDSDQVLQSIHELTEFLSTAQVPFPAGDIFEYWLLDETDDSPLALIYSCCDESVMDRYSGPIQWTALPHSKMNVENTEDEQARNEPPVNARFERLVANRAGGRPRAAWFKRDLSESEGFPGVLVREDWQDQADHDLCQRYLMRKAPRLLMLHSLTTDHRDQLEVAAKQYVFEVEDYFPLYPKVNDERLMTAIRVEARMRRASPQVPGTSKKEKVSSVKPLPKNMRIIES